MKPNLKIQYVKLSALKNPAYNPRRWNDKERHDLRKSIERFGLVDPLIINSAPARRNIIIGGNFRAEVAKEIGFSEVPCVYIAVPDLKKEKELNLRLNKNQGEWDNDLLKDLGSELLVDVGFTEMELDNILNNALNSVEDEKEIQIEPIKKIHILVSIPLDRFLDVKDKIEELKKLEYLEYEQSQN